MTATDDRLPATTAEEGVKVLAEGRFTLYEGSDGSWCLMTQADGSDETLRAPIEPTFVRMIKHFIDTGEKPSLRQFLSPRELMSLLRGM